MTSKPLVTKPKYATRLTRILCELFPTEAKVIVQHHLNIIGAKGINQRDKMQSTFTTVQEYKDLWT